MFVLVFAVPALLVVLLGYAVGHRLWRWIGGMVDGAFGTSIAGGAEFAGWITGALVLAGAVWCLVVLRRRRAR